MTKLNCSFPQTRFTLENSIKQQIGHVLEEADEVREALEQESCGRTEEELADLYHSLETLWRIMERKRGPEYVQHLFQRVIEKNAARNYYTGK